jgi:hypothetical protein
VPELIALVFTLTTINARNRLAITMRTEVGNYQPKARPVSQSGMQRRVRTWRGWSSSGPALWNRLGCKSWMTGKPEAIDSPVGLVTINAHVVINR